MSYLQIDLNQVAAMNNKFRQQTTMVYNLRNQLQTLSYQVDGQIRARRNIEGRLRRVNQTLHDMEMQLRNLNTFVQQSVQRYRDTETYLARQASDIGTRVANSRYGQASFPLYAGANWMEPEWTLQDLKRGIQALKAYFERVIESAQRSRRIMNELNWQYVGMDVEEAMDALFVSACSRGNTAIDDVKKYRNRLEAVQDAMKNGSLTLTKEQLYTLAEIDPHGVRDYIRRQEIESERSKESLPSYYRDLEAKLSVPDNQNEQEPKSFGQSALEFGEAALDFLFLDDYRMLTAPDTTFVERLWAGFSLLPVGKATKLVKLGDKALDAAKAGDKATDAVKGAGKTDLTVKPTAENQKLQNAINQLYRPNATVGNGSTMDAIRHELKTGELVGGKSHLQKGQERVKNLENILNKEQLSAQDKALAEALLQDLKKALSGK